MMPDAQLQQEIIKRLQSVSAAAAKDIGVTVQNGVVILRGSVLSGTEKATVVQAVRRAAGVRVIADEIKVRPPADHQKRDEDIAEAISHVFQTDSHIPATVKATVSNGRVTLTGQVQWEYQRGTAADAVGRLPQITAIDNQVDAV